MAFAGIVPTNCQNIDVLYLGNAGSSAFRSYIVSTDDQCANINFYQADYDGGDNSQGFSTGTGDNLNFYNSTLRNQRATTYMTDVSTTFLASRSGMYNVRATSS